MLKKIKISPLFLLLSAAMILLGFWSELAIYVICIMLHEMAHAETARHLGYALNNIKLMPYGASLTGEFEGAKWSDELLIAVAGPLFNLFIALFFTALWWLAPDTYFFTDTIVWSNFFTAVFNAIPVFPLDGGRVLLSLLSVKMPRQKAYKVLRITGYLFCFLFFVLFLLSLVYKINVSFGIISLFLLVSTVIPDKNSTYQQLYNVAFRSKKFKKGVPVKEVLISDSARLLALVRQSNSNYYYRFIIVDKNFRNIAVVTEARLESLLLCNSVNETIAKAIKKEKLQKSEVK